MVRFSSLIHSPTIVRSGFIDFHLMMMVRLPYLISFQVVDSLLVHNSFASIDSIIHDD